jgi:REP element-mobilizing transposase RayT
MLDSNPTRRAAEFHLMDQAAYTLDESRREVVLAAILDGAKQHSWTILAPHVRTNHVHIIIETDVAVGRVMNDLKSYASRCLNHAGYDTAGRKRWARHGSTRWLRDRVNVNAGIKYVVEMQGEAMALYVSPNV